MYNTFLKHGLPFVKKPILMSPFLVTLLICISCQTQNISNNLNNNSLIPYTNVLRESAATYLKSRFHTFTVSYPDSFYDFPNDSTIEIGSGAGHSNLLRWYKFEPDGDTIKILSILFTYNPKIKGNKFPPDEVSIKCTQGIISLSKYCEFKQLIAFIQSAKIVKSIKTEKHIDPVTGKVKMGATTWTTSANFWSNIQVLNKDGNEILSDNFSGYEGSRTEPEYAKSNACIKAANDFLRDIKLIECNLKDKDKIWATSKFKRDYTKFLLGKDYWWIFQRYILMSGIACNIQILPMLKTILLQCENNDPAVSKMKDNISYYAINATTRLTGKDVRIPPIENMDIPVVRKLVLDQLEELTK
ncbi:MAG: hypothetical protein HY606_06970 [Planctomycetes bacterium]|nr:hypothetical protein [Planctomycetota bacterium]